MGPVDGLKIEVVCCPEPRKVQTVQLTLPHGATVAQAIEHSGFLPIACTDSPSAWGYSIWGHRCELQQPLKNHDRVELCRPLKIDPKEARRQRQARQIARAPKPNRPPKKPC